MLKGKGKGQRAKGKGQRANTICTVKPFSAISIYTQCSPCEIRNFSPVELINFIASYVREIKKNKNQTEDYS